MENLEIINKQKRTYCIVNMPLHIRLYPWLFHCVAISVFVCVCMWILFYTHALIYYLYVFFNQDGFMKSFCTYSPFLFINIFLHYFNDHVILHSLGILCLTSCLLIGILSSVKLSQAIGVNIYVAAKSFCFSMITSTGGKKVEMELVGQKCK